jgi:putative membrane protein
MMPISGALVAAALAAAPGAHAQVTSSPEPAASPWPTVGRDSAVATSALADTAYIRQAIRGNFAEVGLGRLAESRAAESAVEEFARNMVSEHNSMNEQWATLAQKNRMRIRPDPGAAGEQSLEQFEDLSGAAFDQTYMAEMIRQHERDMAAFQRISTSARSAEVRQLAQSGVSTIRDHLARARQVGSRVGVSTTAARTGETVPAPAPSDDARRRTAADGVTGDERDDENDRRRLRAEDRAFVEEVLSDHLLHIRLAKRAQREGSRGETRRLAERIEKDFTEWERRWQNVAARHDAEVDSHLERVDRRKIDKLEEASNRSFDRTYAAIVAERLEVLVHDFRKGQMSPSPAVRRLVNAELPVLREHLTRAWRLEERPSEREEASDRK